MLFLDVVETGTVSEPPLGSLELLQLVFHCIKPCCSGGDNMFVDYLLFHDCLVSGTNIGLQGESRKANVPVQDVNFKQIYQPVNIYSERMNLNKCQQQSNNISFGCLFYISTRPAKT